MKHTHFAKEATVYATNIYTYIASKDEWNTKEDTGKSMKNTLLYIPQYDKRHLSG